MASPLDSHEVIRQANTPKAWMYSQMKHTCMHTKTSTHNQQKAMSSLVNQQERAASTSNAPPFLKKI